MSRLLRLQTSCSLSQAIEIKAVLTFQQPRRTETSNRSLSHPRDSPSRVQ